MYISGYGGLSESGLCVFRELCPVSHHLLCQLHRDEVFIERNNGVSDILNVLQSTRLIITLMFFFLWTITSARHMSELSLHFFTYITDRKIPVLYSALVEVRLITLTVTHTLVVSSLWILFRTCSHSCPPSFRLFNCQIARFMAPAFSSPMYFMYPKVCLYHMQLIRKGFHVRFPIGQHGFSVHTVRIDVVTNNTPFSHLG